MPSTAIPPINAPWLTAKGKSGFTLVEYKSLSSSASPESTPADLSQSTTDLSSADESTKLDSLLDLKSVNAKLGENGTRLGKPNHGTLLDTYGNEFHIPDFTIKDLRDAIPAKCFNRSAFWGMCYVARDLCQIVGLHLLAWWYLNAEYIPSEHFRAFVAWPLFWLIQGASFTGIWVLAHECGHQAFSPSQAINDAVGFVLHSSLFVPYFSWKISHAKHHNYTGNLQKDMVFVPTTRERYASKYHKLVHEVAEMAEDAPIVTALALIVQQLFGWNMYLLVNTSGHNYHENAPDGRGKGKHNGIGGGVNHINPNSPLYSKKDSHLIFLSDLGLIATASVLGYLGYTYGWMNIVFYYVIPYFGVNNWLVYITFLQHTDPTLPHYDAETWTFTRGAAATIDRDFGFIGRWFMHDIVDTHVCHHYFPKIPFYNATEASEAIKPVMGQHYRANCDGGAWGFIKSLWTSARLCVWVEPSEGAQGEGKGVYFFRNNNSKIGPSPARMTAPVS